jgi:hypothetical protein
LNSARCPLCKDYTCLVGVTTFNLWLPRVLSNGSGPAVELHLTKDNLRVGILGQLRQLLIIVIKYARAAVGYRFVIGMVGPPPVAGSASSSGAAMKLTRRACLKGAVVLYASAADKAAVGAPPTVDEADKEVLALRIRWFHP